METRFLRFVTGLVAILVGGDAVELRADLIISFTNGDAFDGHVAASTAGPFNVDGVSGSITTREITPSGVINTTSGRLGINASGGSDSSSRFDDGERWTFDWDIDTLFQGVNFRDFSTNSELFTVQSNDWIGLVIVPGNSEVAFSSGSGTLTFTSGDSADDFSLTDLSGGSLLPVSAGTDIAIGFSDSGGGNGSLEGLTFGAPPPGPASVPEPGTFALSAAALAAMVARRMAQVRSANGRGG